VAAPRGPTTLTIRKTPMKKYKLFVALLIPFLGACPSDGVNPKPDPFYLYSVPSELEAATRQSVEVINDTAGCVLIGTGVPAPFINPIIVVDSHYSGPTVVGCAWVGEALRLKEEPRDTLIVKYIIERPEGAVTTAHEIGHTLGLLHIPGNGVMNPVVHSNLKFGPESTEQLKALCASRENDTEEDSREDIYVVDFY